MASHEHDAWDLEGQIIPFHLTPGIVIASFFVSLIGTITTVELLHRRTNGTGWVTWIQLFAPSVSMGLIGIWCMHYVGNRAIVLGDGRPALQLVYSPGVTAASSFIPIVALFVAYLIADLRYRGKKSMAASLVLSGISAGLAIAGMHYVGNLGVSNYNISFRPAYVGGAITIACAGCVIALTLLFMLQELWISHLFYRLVCAVVLAGAVSGMHFEASMGTTYRLKFMQRDGDSNARNINVIIATILSLLTIPACAAIAVSVSRRRKELADRAQQVVLACARFDPDGKLMVTREGLLPCQKITANQGAFEDEFNVSHPAFQWIFRVSHNWSSITKWLPGMRNHLIFVKNNQDYHKSVKTETENLQFSAEGNAQNDYSIIFRESFCVAAANLASELKLGFSELGVLYDGVMMTGTLNEVVHGRSTSIMNRLKMNSHASLKDVEAGLGFKLFGKGQLLFLVQPIDKKSASTHMSQGYRFVATEKVQSQLAHTMQVPLQTIITKMSNLRAYALSQCETQLSGTLLACFALRAGISKRNWEVLVPNDHRAELPAVQLSPFCLSIATSQYIQQLDGMSVTACIDWLSSQINSTDDGSVGFLRHLRKCILDLVDRVPEPWFRQAVFSSKPTKLPISTTICHPDIDNLDDDDNITLPDSSETRQVHYCEDATMYAFHVIPDVHTSSLKSSVSNTHLQYTPLTFFKCRQQIVPGTPQRARSLATFERSIYQEFAPICSRFSHVDPTSGLRSMSQRRSISGESITDPSSQLHTYPPSAWIPHKDRQNQKSLKQALSSYKISNAFSSRKSVPARSDSSGYLPSPSPLLDSRSEKADSVISHQHSHNESYGMSTFPYGGIMVSSDVTVEREEPGRKASGEIQIVNRDTETTRHDSGSGPQAALGRATTGKSSGTESKSTTKLGTTAHASVVDPEEPNFVDDLVRVAVRSLRRS